MAKITTSQRAQRRKHQRCTENSNPINSIEVRVYKVNGTQAKCNHAFYVSYEHFKGAIFEEFKEPSSQIEQQEYFKAITQSIEGKIHDFKTAVGTFSFLACCNNVIHATLKRFSEEKSFGIVILCSDMNISVLCMSSEELNNLDNCKGIKII